MVRPFLFPAAFDNARVKCIMAARRVCDYWHYKVNMLSVSHVISA